MNKFTLELVSGAGIFIPIFVAVFLPIFCVLFIRKPRQEPYLKRVARKYSIPPLDLR